MVIGITGNSGTGKSEISKILANRISAKIINADSVVKEMSKQGNKYFEEIIKLFGTDILEKGMLNRKKIANIIYEDTEKRAQLDNLTFKYVVNEIKNMVKNANFQSIIIDAPLLFESKLNEICDYTIAILAKKERKIQRICSRDKIEENIAAARLNIQADDEFYIQKADYILTNDGSIDEINLEEICTKIGKN